MIEYTEVFFKVLNNEVYSAADGSNKLIDYLNKEQLEVVCLLAEGILLAKKRNAITGPQAS